jgi:hypothetical protein
LITSPIIVTPITLKIRTTQGWYRKRRRKADKKTRAIPSDKTKMVRIILLNISFIGTSKNENRRQYDCFDSGPTIVGFLRRISPDPITNLPFLVYVILKK